MGQARGDAVFCGYGDGDPDVLRHFRYSALKAEDFLPGDRLVLAVPEGFDLLGDIKESCSFQNAMIATMPVGESMTMEEARNRILPEMERTQQADAETTVLRFCRDR